MAEKNFYFNRRGAVVFHLNQLKAENALGLKIKYLNIKNNLVGPFGSVEWGTVGYKYDQQGTLLEKCAKSSKQKVMSGKSSVEQSEDLMPCFSQAKTQKIVEYLDNKRPEGSLSVVAGKSAHVLIIMPKNEKEAAECLYFKN